MRTEIALKISGDLGELKGVREAVRAFLDSTKHIDIGEDAAAGLDSIAQSRIILAIDEAVANIIEHGFSDPQSLAGAQISLTMRKEPKLVEFEIRDNGVAFNPLEKKPDTELYYEEGLENGMGLVALTTLDCAYRRDGGHNLLILRREWGNGK
ncbi:MAG: ATP-binding protein [Leptospiraceae bacterium]|nr:ATP-binding protein [Leptospiraceae bacterium]